MNTPWGKSDHKKEYVKGITFYGTPGHGGFKVSKHVLAVMPKAYVNEDGWYEEDCEALKVYMAFPHLFPRLDMESIQKSYDHWFDDKGEYKQRGNHEQD